MGIKLGTQAPVEQRKPYYKQNQRPLLIEALGMTNSNVKLLKLEDLRKKSSFYYEFKVLRLYFQKFAQFSQPKSKQVCNFFKHFINRNANKQSLPI